MEHRHKRRRAEPEPVQAVREPRPAEPRWEEALRAARVAAGFGPEGPLPPKYIPPREPTPWCVYIPEEGLVWRVPWRLY